MLDQFSQRASLFQHAHLAGDGVFRAIDPAVFVIAAQNPLIGLLGSGDLSDDVIQRHGVPVECQLQVNFRGPRTNVVGNGESAAPLLWSHGAFERCEERLRVTVGNRHHGNLGERGIVLDGDSLGVVRSSNARCEWVSWIRSREIHYAASLNAVRGTHGTLGEDILDGVTVVMRIGIDQAADRAVLGGDFRFDAAPRSAVSHNHDRAFYGNSEAIQFVVVFGHAVIGENKRRGYVAVNRIGVVGGQLFVLLIRGGVSGDRRFLKLGREFCGRYHFQQALLGSGKQHFEGLNVGVPSPFLELREDPLGILLVVS